MKRYRIGRRRAASDGLDKKGDGLDGIHLPDDRWMAAWKKLTPTYH